MASQSYTLIIAYIIIFGAYWAWLFLTKLPILSGLLFGFSVDAQKLIVRAICILAGVVAPSFLPKIFQDYSIAGMILGFGIVPFFSWRNVLVRKSNLGDLLFTSQHTPIINYIYLLVILCTAMWALPRYHNKFFSQGLSAIITAGDTEISAYIYGICYVIFVLSSTVFFSLSNWIKLEIRDHGLWMMSTATTWEEIIDYSWSEQQQNLLIVKSINGFNKEIENKYRVLSTEKATVTSILKEKIK